MCSDHRRLHVALAAPLAGSATQHKARFPSPPSPPSYRHRPANHGCSPRSIASTQEGAAAFNNALRQSSSPSRLRAGSAALRGARWPLVSFTALLSPSSYSSQLFTVEHRPHPGGCSFFQLCAPTTIVSTSPSRPLWPGPPRCASPSSLRRLHHPAIAIAQLTTGVRLGASPAPGRVTAQGATFFHAYVSTTIVSTSPSGRVRRAPRVPLPLVAFTTLLSPLHRPPRVFTKEYHHECSARSLPQHQGPQRRPAPTTWTSGPHHPAPAS